MAREKRWRTSRHGVFYTLSGMSSKTIPQTSSSMLLKVKKYCFALQRSQLPADQLSLHISVVDCLKGFMPVQFLLLPQFHTSVFSYQYPTIGLGSQEVFCFNHFDIMLLQLVIPVGIQRIRKNEINDVPYFYFHF